MGPDVLHIGRPFGLVMFEGTAQGDSPENFRTES